MSSHTDPIAEGARLVTLPYELRQHIFKNVFKIDGGYAYAGGSEKLLTADGQRIDLSLMYTCRSIYKDTKHIPLSVNTITFSTVYREDWREQAGGFAFIMEYYRLFQNDLIYELRHLITAEIESRLALKFPKCMTEIRERIAYLRVRERFSMGIGLEPNGPSARFKDNLDSCMWYKGIQDRYWLGTARPWDSWVFPASLNSGALSYILRLLAEKHPNEVADKIDMALPGWSESYSLHEFFSLSFDPWAIPSLSEVVVQANILQLQKIWGRLQEWGRQRMAM